MTRPRVVLLLLFFAGVVFPAGASDVEAAPATPNILLILTDDQPWDTMWAMPLVQSRLADEGVTFSNGFVPTALCCPSRASILTGTMSHTHGIYDNGNGFGKFSDASTIATWLHDAGYRTGLFGKYLNGYDPEEAAYVPPGWDRWVAFVGQSTTGQYSIDGVYAKPNAYSTDYLRDHAITFIESTPQDQPVFVHYSPFAPHGGQKAATRHRKTFPNLAPRRPPSYNEADVSDKTAYVQSFPLASSTEQALYDKGYKKTMQTLPAVDEAVDAIVDALEAAGRLNDTIIVFTSDNGLQWGEHRLFGIKSFPYEESIRVPFIVRYDALGITPRSDPRFVLNIDLAPTFADLAGVETPGVEGQSFLPLLSDPETPWRTDFMIENAYKTILTYCGVRNEDYTYVYHSSGEEELYDLAADPYQMSNVASSPSMAETVSALRARTAELCQPPPPKWSPPLG